MTKKRGFTLIELLVVIAIIGILSTLSVIALNSARARARDAKRISDVRQIQTALEMYYSEHNNYPVAYTGSVKLAMAALAAGVIPEDELGLNLLKTTNPPLLTTVPKSPSPADGGCGNYNDYVYSYSNTGGSQSSYTIRYCLGSATGGIGAGIQYASPAGIGLPTGVDPTET